MVYNNKHKIVLQTFMNKGLLTENEVKDLIIKLFNDDEICIVINPINQKLQYLNMLIKRAECEITGDGYWIIISTTLDEITRCQQEFSKDHFSFLRAIFSEIITSPHGFLQSTACLNLSFSLNVKLSKADADDFLNDMVERKWLAYKNGSYFMGVRSISELMPYFRVTYEANLNTCNLCKQGEKCDSCDTSFHIYCLKRYIMIQNPMMCPMCNAVISNIHLHGITNNQLLSRDNKKEKK